MTASTDDRERPLGAVDVVAVGGRGLLELVALGAVSYWGTTLGALLGLALVDEAVLVARDLR